jgi:hypothetical protein
MTDVAAVTGPRAIAAKAWPREEHNHYVEPRWCVRRLIEEEAFEGNIMDPCCGFGRIVQEARAAGFVAEGMDIADRGFEYLTIGNFLTSDIPAANFIFNPPFEQGEDFAFRALKLASRKVAMFYPTRRLNAAGAWLRGTPLLRIWYLTPRPSMPPGHVARELEAKGKEPSGGTQDFCVLVWLKGYDGPASIRWLHRDEAKQ